VPCHLVTTLTLDFTQISLQLAFASSTGSTLLLGFLSIVLFLVALDATQVACSLELLLERFLCCGLLTERESFGHSFLLRPLDESIPVVLQLI
jgi:hypothetical protein